MPRATMCASPRPWPAPWPAWRCRPARRWPPVRRCSRWRLRPSRPPALKPKTACWPARRKPAMPTAAGAPTSWPSAARNWRRPAPRPHWRAASWHASSSCCSKALSQRPASTMPALPWPRPPPGWPSWKPRCAWPSCPRARPSARPRKPAPAPPARPWRKASGAWHRRRRPRRWPRWWPTPTTALASGCRPAARCWPCCRPGR